VNVDDESLLMELLAGDRSDDDPEVAARIAADPQLRERLLRLRQVASRLDQSGVSEREVLREVLAPPPSDVQALSLKRGPRFDHVVPPWWRRPWLLGAVAAGLLVVGGVWLTRGPGEATDHSLLGGQDDGRSPMETFRRDTVWQWGLRRGPSDVYRLRFRTPDEVLEFDVDEPSWRPNEQQWSKLTPPLTWEVMVVTINGDVVARLPAISVRRQ
jgi:hypothetical protein